MYREYRDFRDRLHRTDGPAVESDDRKEWWVEGRRHNERGPSITTKHGTVWHYWRGTLVPKEVIEDPRSKKPADILKIENVEVRRSWMEAYGLDDFMLDMKPKVLHHLKEKDLMLVSLKVPNDEDLVMVRVKNSTPEGKWVGGTPCQKCVQKGYTLHPDSTPDDEVRIQCHPCLGTGKVGMDFVPELKDGKPYFKHYFLRVPPTMKDAEEAVAWTFGKKKGEYSPVVET